MFTQSTFAAAAVTLVANVVVGADDPLPCVPMGELYPTGEELCETMWDDAFEVVDDADGYTMWPFDEVNPNDDVSEKRNLSGADKKCYLDDFFHKAVPGPEPLDNECGVFRGNACCNASNVPGPEALQAAYGANYRWDRCGKLSPQCERFFVQEACFYECDANNGYWRKFVDESVVKMPDNDTGRFVYNPKCNSRDETEWDDIAENGKSPTGEEFYKNNKAYCNNTEHNRWQLWKTPIKRSYCKNWHAACKNDLFCGIKDGSYFKCARLAPVPAPKIEKVEVLSDGATAGITIAVLLVAVAVAVIVYMAVKERSGEPVFEKLPEQDDDEKVEMDRDEDLKESAYYSSLHENEISI